MQQGPVKEAMSQELISQNWIWADQDCMKTLGDGKWLDDATVKFGLRQLAMGDKMLVLFNSVFPVKLASGVWDSSLAEKWSQRLPEKHLLDNDILLTSINVGNLHWVLVVFDLNQMQIAILDSLHGENEDMLGHMVGWIEAEVRVFAAANKGSGKVADQVRKRPPSSLVYPCHSDPPSLSINASLDCKIITRMLTSCRCEPSTKKWTRMNLKSNTQHKEIVMIVGCL